jgi:hypothetical protein
MRNASAGPPTSPRGRSRRVLKNRAATTVALGVTLLAAGGAIVGSAAVPSFPDNVVVFPDRDFVTIEGYQNHIGETATVEVSRAGSVIGSAQAEVQEGDVAFEINHPGGVCWGAGTTDKVTPDIRPGDVVSVKFAGRSAGDTTVQDTYVDADSSLSGSTVTVQGHIGPNVLQSQMEQRIIEPALVDTAVGRRDVRAVPGPLTPAAKGGYSSKLEFSGESFTATYVFDDPAVARIAAAAGGERAMAWQLEDADANRQGLTIAEHGELGGPGMGGCPAGPGDQAAPQPGTASVIRSADKTSLQVVWEPASPQPGAAAVTGYSVEAIARTVSSTGQHQQVGMRAPAEATRTTISALSATEAYDVEVRSLAGARMSDAFTAVVPSPSTVPPGTDVTLPTLSASPAPSANGVTEATSVKLTSDGQVFYTTDGTPALLGDMPADNARLYSGPIPITAATTLNIAAFDTSGNHRQLSGTYAPPAGPSTAPDAPTGLTGVAGQASVALKWTATDPSITGYGVQVYDGGGAKVGALKETPDKTLTVDGLEPGSSYAFTVQAKNAKGYGTESAKAGPFTPKAVTDRVTITSAKWKAGDFRVVGTSSATPTVAAPVTMTVRSGSPTGPSLGQGPLDPAVAPATGGTYSLRFRNNAAPATRPGQIYVVSSRGGVAGPFTVG